MPPNKIWSLFPAIPGDSTESVGPPKTVPPRFIASSADGAGFESLSKERYLQRREAPASTFEGCEKPSLIKGWLNALGMFGDWARGSGDSTRVFDTCSLESQNMADAPDVNQARELLYSKNEGLPFEEWKPVTNFSGAFGVSELVVAGVDPTEQFVGSYRVDIFPQPDKTLRFELRNTTSMESFLYGAGPEYEREDFPHGGNMRQVYSWTEPVELP